MDAGVVDQSVDSTLVGGDIGGRCGDGRVVGHVDADKARAECGGGLRASLGMSCAEQHGVTEFDERRAVS